MSGLLPPLRLTGAKVMRDGGLQIGAVSVENGAISHGHFPEVDLGGYLILPGIIDMHGDAFERHLAPRPSAPMEIASGLASTVRDAAAHGVTTAWLAQCWSWEGGQRGPDFAETLLEAVTTLRETALIDLYVQLRCETHMVHTADRMIAAIQKFGVNYVVFNDHLPDALQTSIDDPATFAKWAQRDGRTPEEFLALIKAAKAQFAQVPRHLCRLAEAFEANGIRFGSHDDPDGETRETYRLLGAEIAEFPLSHQAAALAKACNDPVVMGAPNVVRGGSQSGNVDAMSLIRNGLCDALVSDYHYPCLAAAAWVLVDKGRMTLPEAWGMISTAPAQIMHLTDRGVLAPGRRADLVIVNEETRAIEATISAGRVAYMAGDLACRLVGRVGEHSLAAE